VRHDSPLRRRAEPAVPHQLSRQRPCLSALDGPDWRIATFAIVACALAAPLAAQTVCRPSVSSNEAKTLATFSVPLAFGPATAPEILPGLRVGLEGTYLPKVDPATATPTICRPGEGPLKHRPPVCPAAPAHRAAAAVRAALQASWLPPERVAGAKANLFGSSLGKSFGRLDGLAALISKPKEG
jgi:hypothetical protein